MENKTVLWDYVKCHIRSETIAYSTKKMKETKLKEKLITNTLETLEKLIAIDNKYLEEYLIAKQEWENFQMMKTNGIIMRSKAVWVEKREKNTKYFHNLEKRNYNIKHIQKLILEDDTIITNPEKIIQKQK